MISMLFFSILNISITAEDTALPIIDYFGARPHVQLKNRYVNISCVVKDNAEIQTVEVIIFYPNEYNETEIMSWSPDGKYVYSKIYDVLGNYSFYVVIEDKEGSIVNTTSKFFWITLDKDDIDSDGMPDWWEEKYDLDPENPKDAGENSDGDEYTNLMEYQIGTNPSKDIFLQNAAYRVRYNSGYLTLSAFLFLFIVVLSIYGLRRRTI